MKLFLDDVRSPTDCLKYMDRRIGQRNLVYKEGNWVIVRNYDQFVEYLKTCNDLRDIEVVSFDHDLGPDHYIIDGSKEAWEEYHGIENREKTGLDCLKYLLECYMFFSVPLPELLFHTMNLVGLENMESLAKGWKKAFY